MLNARRTGHADIVAEQIHEAADDVRLSPRASTIGNMQESNMQNYQ
jgi:hypothetical protein